MVGINCQPEHRLIILFPSRPFLCDDSFGPPNSNARKTFRDSSRSGAGDGLTIILTVLERTRKKKKKMPDDRLIRADDHCYLDRSIPTSVCLLLLHKQPLIRGTADVQDGHFRTPLTYFIDPFSSRVLPVISVFPKSTTMNSPS